jgi:hypothetical protein
MTETREQRCESELAGVVLRVSGAFITQGYGFAYVKYPSTGWRSSGGWSGKRGRSGKGRGVDRHSREVEWMGDGVFALLGYAVGRRHLQLLRAELTRASSFERRFNWQDPTSAPRPMLPRAPNVSRRFDDTVSDCEFSLSDASDDQNTQQALIAISDSCGALKEYLGRIREKVQAYENSQADDERNRLAQAIFEMAGWYDERHIEVSRALASSIADLDQRREEVKLWRQISRVAKWPKGLLRQQ